MTIKYVVANVTSTSNTTNTETIASGNGIFVLAGVDVIDEGQTNGSYPIYGQGYGSAQIDGTVVGDDGIVFAGAAGEPTSIQIGATGLVATSGDTQGSVAIETGEYNVVNLGEIDSTGGSATNLYGDGLDVDAKGATTGFTYGSGGGTVTNKGTIDSLYGSGVLNADSSAADIDTLDNWGTIYSGAAFGLYDVGGHATIVVNYGTIASAVGDAVYAESTEALSNFGQIAGYVDLGDDSSLVNSGTINGSVWLGQDSSLADSGTIVGAVYLSGAIEGATDVTVSSTGVVSSDYGDDALTIAAGVYDIVNDGEIHANQVTGNGAAVSGIDIAGAGTIVNNGTISSSGGDDIVNSANGDVISTIYNYGTLSGPASPVGAFDAIDDIGAHTDTIFNYGAINAGFGSVCAAISSSSADIVDNAGTIAGRLALGDDSSLQDSGKIDGAVTFDGATVGTTDVTVTSTGIISAAPGYNTLYIASGLFDIVNDGEILNARLDDNMAIVASSSGRIVNKGTISSSGGQGIYETAGAGEDDFISNYGTISGNSAIQDFNGHTDTIHNYGAIDGLVYAIYSDSSSDDVISNAGTISGQINAGDNSSLTDFGTIDGAVTLAGATVGATDVTVSGTGVISGTPGLIALYIASGAYDIKNDGEITASQNSGNTGFAAGILVEGPGTIINRGTIQSSGDEAILSYAATGIDDYLYNYGTISDPGSGAGDYDAIDDSGNHTDTIFNYGAIDGGSTATSGSAIYSDNSSTDIIYNSGTISGLVEPGGPNSQIVNHGEIDGEVDFSSSGARFVNAGSVVGNVTFSGTGNVFNGAAGTVTGTIYGAGSNGVYYSGADNETFNFTAAGSAPALVVGGAGSDTFIFTAAGLTSATKLRGAVGAANDVLEFSTAGTISTGAFSHVSGIETIDLANGTDNLTVTNAMVGSATGDLLTINDGTGADTINASGVTVAADKVQFDAGIGASTFNAGGGTDTFVYTAANQSTGPNYDTISGANFGQDYFDIPGGIGSVLAINPAVTTGSLSTTTFNADLATAIGAAQLGAHDAVLFTPNAGTLAGQTFLVMDTNGHAGYTANADLVIHLTAQTGTLTTGNFV